MIPDDFEFTIVENPGMSGGERYPVLDVRPQGSDSATFFAAVWSRCQSAYAEFDKANTRQPKGWCRWQVAQWAKYDPLDDQRRYAAWHGDVLVGFLNLRTGFPSRLVPGSRTVYVEHVATAPGNIPTPLWGQRYGRVGTALLAYSVLVSALEGFGGRISLHSADADVEAFYSGLNRRYRLFPHREDGGVAGPSRPRQTNVPGVDQVYLESEPAGGMALLEEYRRG